MREDVIREGDALPPRWVWRRLGEISTIVRGITFPKDERSDQPQPGLIACLRTTNVQAEVDWEDLWFVPEHFVRRQEQHVQPYDILISTANSLELVGKVALVKNMPRPASLGAFISLLRVAPDLDPVYVYHQIAWSETQSLLHGWASTTTNISNISTSKLADLPIRIAPLPEQRRIVAEIEKQFTRLDTGVAALKRVQVNLRRYRASVLKAACEGRLAPQDPTDEPADRLLARILVERRARWEAEHPGKKYVEPAAPVSDGLPELPERWCWASLGQLAWDSGYGTSQKCDYEASGPPVLRIPNIAKGRIDLNDLKCATLSDELNYAEALTPGDLIIVRTNGSKDLIGRSAVVRDTFVEPHFFASYLIRFRLLAAPSVPEWLGTVWNAPLIRRQIEGIAATSAGQYNVSMGGLSKLSMPLPPLPEQHRIVAEVERRLSVVAALEATVAANLARAGRLRQAVLKRAFEGRLVAQDESAEVLSARVR